MSMTNEVMHALAKVKGSAGNGEAAQFIEELERLDVVVIPAVDLHSMAIAAVAASMTADMLGELVNYALSIAMSERTQVLESAVRVHKTWKAKGSGDDDA